MKILLYGETNKIGSGAWCYYQAIKGLNYECQVYSDWEYLLHYKTNYIYKVLRKLNRRSILSKDRVIHTQGLIELTMQFVPDIVIILKGLHIDYKCLITLKKHSKYVVNLNHDDFFSFNKNNRSITQLRSVPYYDYIFVTRNVNVNEIKPLNPNVELLMFAYSKLIHKEYNLSLDEFKKYECDVLFVGTFEKNRANFLEKAIDVNSVNLSIYGNGWEKLSANSPIRKCIKNFNGIWGEELAKAIKSAKICLGFLRKENRDDYTQRSFEIPACGGILLAEDTDFHRQLFIENEEAVFFDINNPKSLSDKIQLLLFNSQLRENIRKKGNAKVISTKNSYEDRIYQIINKFNNL